MDVSSSTECLSSGGSTEKGERVNVFVRVKPDCRGDGQRRDSLSLYKDVNGHGIRVRREGRHGVQQKQFVFDQVLDETATQADVYNAVAQPIVDDVLQGYNGTILAYGQTGAGKTHTLSSIKPECIGVIPRAAQDVFQKVQDEDTCTVRLSYLQIYCEQIQDLLKPETGDNLSIREGKKGLLSVPELSEMEVTCLDDCLRLLQLGDRNRSVAFTALNAHSSRSHAVVIFTVIRYDEIEKRNKVGKLFLVDLAGSERLKKSKSVAQRAVEARAINLSLTTLGKCVSARAMGSAHVPFRDSKLTRLLQESLGGNAKTSMIIAISGDAEHSDETYQSLEFGSRAMHVTTHAEVNVDGDVLGSLDVVGDSCVATAREAFLQSSLDASAFIHMKKEQERSKEVIECLEREKLMAIQENQKLQDEHEEELRIERREKEALQNRALQAENKAMEAETAATKKIDELRNQLDRALGQLDEMERNHEQERASWEERHTTLECLVDSYKSSQASLQAKYEEAKGRLQEKIKENVSQRHRILELEGQVDEERSNNLQTSQILAQVQNELESKISECHALRDVCSSKDDEYGDSMRALEESIESKYKKDIALCMKQIATFKDVIEREKKDLFDARQSLKETQEHTKVLEEENETLRVAVEAAKKEASHFKRQAKEAIFKFDILNRHFRKLEAENKAATTIQRAYRKYRTAQLRKQQHSNFQELARTKHELGSLAARHAEMAAKRNSNLAFTGQTLLGEGLEVLQEAVEGLLTTFLLPSKDLKALQRYNSKMKTNKLSGRDVTGLIPSATYTEDTKTETKNHHLHYYNLNGPAGP